MRRFPFVVLFEYRRDDVEIVAVYHCRRNPRGWSDRVSEPALAGEGSRSLVAHAYPGAEA